MVRPPGPMRGGLGSGLVGDTIGNHKVHGGDDQAVYAYAREDLDGWETQLARSLTNGMFGENLTTTDVAVTGARIGERWRIGWTGARSLRAPYSLPHLFGLPATGSLDQDLHRGGEPRSLSRVISPGAVRSGDTISIDYRPDHDVTIGIVFRARMSEPDLLPQLLLATRCRRSSRTMRADGLRRTNRRLLVRRTSLGSVATDAAFTFRTGAAQPRARPQPEVCRGGLGRCRRRRGGIRTAVSRCGDIARNGLRSAARPAQVFRRLESVARPESAARPEGQDRGPLITTTGISPGQWPQTGTD